MKKLLAIVVLGLFLFGCDQSKEPSVKNKRYLICSHQVADVDMRFILIQDVLIAEKIYGTTLKFFTDATFSREVSGLIPTLYSSEKFFVFALDTYVFIINRLNLSATLVKMQKWGNIRERKDIFVEQLIGQTETTFRCRKVSKPKKQI